jgi:glucans biosynthesis protein
MHGGAAGSGAPIGNKNALRHGRYSADAIARRRQMSELIRRARATLAEIEERTE